MKKKYEAVDLKPGVRVPESKCPYCGEAQDGASGTTSHYPEPGDVSICIHCAEVSVFDESLQRCKWPEHEPVPEYVARYQSLVRQAHGS